MSSTRHPCDLDLCPSDLESGVRVTCDVGYLASLVSNYSRCTQQTDVRQKHRLMHRLGAGVILRNVKLLRVDHARWIAVELRMMILEICQSRAGQPTGAR